MIQANELRINNRYRLNGKGFTLDMKMMYAFCSGSFQYDLADVEGIPLSEPLLLKLGFIKDVTFTRGRVMLWWSHYLKAFQYRFGYDSHIVIRSLHSLQTLYFALTEEELIAPKT